LVPICPRILLLVATLGGYGWAVETGPAGDSSADRRPNLVIVLADDLGYGDIHCYNPDKGKIPTPHVDRLAADGMRFTDCHSPSSLCSPTRYGLLTGRYAWRTRLQHHVLRPYDPPLIDRDRLTLPSFLRGRGYATACIGKWHLGWQWARRNGEYVFDAPISDGPTARGFDYYFGTDIPNCPPYCFIENDRTVGRPTGWKAKLDMDGPPGPELPGWKREAILPTLVEKCVEYIGRRAEDGKPFFLYVALNSPHEPIAPSASFRGKSGISAVADFIMETDWATGQIVDALDRNGLRESTIVAFTADNGRSCYAESEFETLQRTMNIKGHYPSGPWRGFKSNAWEGGHRVPMVVRWPGRVPPGSVNDGLVCLVDWMATMAELLGERLPDGAGEDSVGFLSLLTGRPSRGRDHLVLHSADGRFALRQGQWKLILCPGSGGYGGLPNDEQARARGLPPVQLYDLRTDPGETRNLQAEQPAKVRELTALLQHVIDNGRSTSGPSRKNDVHVTCGMGKND